VPGLPEATDGVGPTGDRIAGHVEDPVDVKQNRCHGRRVYSRDPISRSPPR